MSSVPPLSQQNEYNVTVPPSNAGVTHPASIAVNVQDSKASQGFSQGLTENDRQHPDDTANQLHHYPQKHDHDAKWWTYRVLVGKDYKEFQIEKEKKKPIDWIIQEFTVHLAEFIGTMFLVIFVAGIQVNQDFFPDGGVANIDKGMVSGLILTGLIYAFGKVSGAHFNPLVTLAFLLRGSFNVLRAITYISVQFAGAVSGAALLYHWFGNVGPGLGTTTPGAGVKDYAAVEIEMLMTFILITVILATTERGSKILSAVSGLAVGMTFGAVEIWAWNFTGASVNPWRTIGPTMISNYGWDTYWIYLVGTSSGMFLAVIVQRVMMTGVKHEKKKQAEIKAALKAQAKAEAQARA